MSIATEIMHSATSAAEIQSRAERLVPDVSQVWCAVGEVDYTFQDGSTLTICAGQITGQGEAA